MLGQLRWRQERVLPLLVGGRFWLFCAILGVSTACERYHKYEQGDEARPPTHRLLE